MPKDSPVAFSHHLEANAVAKYFIQRDSLRAEPDVTPLKLQKLMYLAQSNFLASTGQRLFDENVEAFENGPVVYKTWGKYPGRNIIAVTPQNEFSSNDDEHVPADTAIFLDAVWEMYRDVSASQLWTLTHKQDPWKNHYVLNSYRKVIPDEDMQSYFRETVPLAERIFHEGVLAIPATFFDSLNDDDIAAQLVRFLDA
ncbi:Panacea domain-containing protein [Cryobacterium sp. Y62]|uniref:Panacea domain-containing protein n=1 Tax=Cryobacterium sp. Y62 TaxID=2048284 RepID=UPI001304D634|nr:type II toxin-antitoxin system antitoxin SocA domain-containing protein [Cryobacterium sp. Y62]